MLGDTTQCSKTRICSERLTRIRRGSWFPAIPFETSKPRGAYFVIFSKVAFCQRCRYRELRVPKAEHREDMFLNPTLIFFIKNAPEARYRVLQSGLSISMCLNIAA